MELNVLKIDLETELWMAVKNVTFEKIELSKIDNDIHHIRKEYYGRNLWVVLWDWIAFKEVKVWTSIL